MSDVLADAQKLYLEALDAARDQRQQIVEDSKFSDPSNPQQWEEDVKRARENDPGGRRPCLVLDQTGQFVANVAGNVEKQPPSLHAIPVGGGADKDAAEQLDGRFRHIEYASRADQHYVRALTAAARLGVGYLIVRPTVINHALNWQEPRISSEPNPLNVVFDPWSEETDGSDADFGFLLAGMSTAQFNRKWPGKDAKSFGEGDDYRKRDIRETIIVAEQMVKVETKRNIIVFTGQDGEETSLPEDEFWAAHKLQQVGQPLRNYTEKTSSVKWRRMSGADVLEESDYPADMIGIVPVYGYLGWVDERMTFCGIPRRARSAQQAYNYHKSELLMPGAQIAASKRAVRGVEQIWDRAQTERRAFLPFNDLDEDGSIAPPTLLKIGSNLIDHVGGAESALRDIQASIGMYQANLGAPSNETSGVAIDSRKQQGEASTAHFPSHMAASLGQIGRIVQQMDKNLADTKRRVALVGVDGTAGSVTIDPEQQEAFKRDESGVSINPRVGDYGVRVTVGASYSTQRQTTNQSFAEIMRGNPDMAPIVAPFWAQTLDFPGADKFSQALAAMAPPPVKAILQPEGQDKGPQPAELMQQIEQMQKALQEATSIAHEAEQAESEALKDAADAKRQLAAKHAEIETAQYKAETERLKVVGANEQQIQQIVFQLVNQMLEGAAPLPGDPQPMPVEPEAPPEPALPGAGPAQEPPMAGGLPPEAPIEGAEPSPTEEAPMAQESPQ